MKINAHEAQISICEHVQYIKMMQMWCNCNTNIILASIFYETKTMFKKMCAENGDITVMQNWCMHDAPYNVVFYIV